MKKITAFITASCIAAASLSVSAADTSDDYIEYITLTGLDSSEYYTICAKAHNPDIASDAVLFAGDRTTVIPVGFSTVYIRGVKPENGKIIAGYTAREGFDVVIDSITGETGEEYTFLQGGDITQANYIASLGGTYYDPDGKEGDPVSILAENGVGLARIRLSNTTGKGTGDGDYYLPAGFQDLDDCLDLCRRAKENGMQIEFTFNLSDYWSNAERQIVPSQWAAQIKSELGYDITDTDFLKSMTAAEKKEITEKLTEILYNYVKEVMEKLAAQGTTPEYVSIGNEVNGGLLFPFGTAYDMQLSSHNLNTVWGDAQSEEDIITPAETEALAGFMNAGYDAVKAVSPDTQVIIHLAEGAKFNAYTWTLDLYKNAGAKFDILGASYYPAWSDNTVEGCVDFCNRVYEKYNMPIMIMETGFNWNATMKNGNPGQLWDIDAYKDKYPPSKESQKAYLADLYNGLKSVDGGACIGAIYWDPIMIHVEDPARPGESLSGWAIRESDDGTEPDIVENTTFFDFDGNALPVFDVLSSHGLKSASAVLAEYDANGALRGVSTLKTVVPPETLKDFTGWVDDSQKLFVFSK
ncbi:MAG: glycosyl hydrolase 53 family protein [Candidatus Ornithomonoglobus sp.]